MFFEMLFSIDRAAVSVAVLLICVMSCGVICVCIGLLLVFVLLLGVNCCCCVSCTGVFCGCNICGSFVVRRMS